MEIYPEGFHLSEACISNGNIMKDEMGIYLKLFFNKGVGSEDFNETNLRISDLQQLQDFLDFVDSNEIANICSKRLTIAFSYNRLIGFGKDIYHYDVEEWYHIPDGLNLISFRQLVNKYKK